MNSEIKFNFRFVQQFFGIWHCFFVSMLLCLSDFNFLASRFEIVNWLVYVSSWIIQSISRNHPSIPLQKSEPCQEWTFPTPWSSTTPPSQPLRTSQPARWAQWEHLRGSPFSDLGMVPWITMSLNFGPNISGSPGSLLALCFNRNSRILKWRYCTYCAIYGYILGYISLHSPYIGPIHGRYLHFRILEFPLTVCEYRVFTCELPVEAALIVSLRPL